MTVKVVSYGSTHDEKFQTTCKHTAEAFDFVHSLKPQIEGYVRDNTDNKTPGNFKGAVERYTAFLVWFETQRRLETPQDYFGMDSGPENVIDGVVKVSAAMASMEPANHRREPHI